MRKYYLQESEWQGLEEDARVSLIIEIRKEKESQRL